jgi:hypothetical protein
MTNLRLSGGVIAATLILALPFGAVGSGEARGRPACLASGEPVSPAVLLEPPSQADLLWQPDDRAALNGEIVSVAECKRKYSPGGLIRRLCCSSACHPYDILCYGDCVHGVAPKEQSFAAARGPGVTEETGTASDGTAG